MKSFQSALTATEYELVRSAVKLRFKKPEEFKTPEALIIYEHGILDEEHLFELVKEEYSKQELKKQEFVKPLEMPKRTYLTSEIVEYFRGKDCIPLSYDNINNTIHVAVLPEKENLHIEKWNNVEIKKHLVPIYYYVDNFTKLYNMPEFLLEIPEHDLFNYIVYEAIELGATDITLSSNSTQANVYYNVKKTRINTKKRISNEQVDKISKFLQCKAEISIDQKHRKSIFFSMELNCHYRGRIAINSTYCGDLITIRILKNDIYKGGLDKLNISDSTIAFIRDTYTSDESGLRLMVGPTYSGKNTTIISALYEKLKVKESKAISFELPLEYPLEFMEQINCNTEEDFKWAVSNLLRQNPDIVYITEMLEYTAKTAIDIANAGKAVYTAVHANSIADAILRMQDITGLPLDRIVMGIQSVIFQELVANENEIRPINKCLYFSKELKASLMGLSYGDIVLVLRKEEEKWV